MIRAAAVIACIVGAVGGVGWFAGDLLATQEVRADNEAEAKLEAPTLQKIDEARREIRRERTMLNRMTQFSAPDPEPPVNQMAAMALGRIGFAAVEPLAFELQQNPDPVVRLQATAALAFIGPEAEGAVPQLTAALRDDSVAVRRGAARALGQIGPGAAPAIPALIDALDDTASSDLPAPLAAPPEFIQP